MSARTHVLVVDDSAFMRKALSGMLEKDPRISVVGTARNGEELSKSGLFNARLISMTPLNPANSAREPFETEALKAIMSGADSYARVEESKDGSVAYRRRRR